MADLPRILIVDDSRVVRTMLMQHLKGHYEVREEADGEAAWQTLILDHSIQAVISDLHMPKMGGFELLDLVRASKLHRLQELPFILVSGDETEEDRAQAREKGVSDFITKGVGSSEILLRLNHLLALSNARENLDAGRERMVQDPKSGLYTKKFLELQTAQALSHTTRHGGDSSLMVLGFDGFAELGERLGSDVAEEIGNRFARMLGGKIRQEDSLGHFGAGQYAIISPGTAPSYCATFAERVRQAVEVARLTVHGETVAVTVSIGLAAVPVDHVASGGALLELAGERMREAMANGGNRISSGGVVAAKATISLNHALELLASNRPEVVKPYLGVLGKQVLPLLQLMYQELGLTLPLAEIERCLAEREVQK